MNKHKPIKALLLEDVPRDAELLRELLIGYGYDISIEVVDTKMAFVEKLRRTNYDIIYADFTLPGFNGEEALMWSKQICPNVPFIFISGTIGEDKAVELVKQGATDYVLKDRMDRTLMATNRALEAAEQFRAFREKEIENQTSRRLLQNIINNAKDVIFVKDIDGKYLLYNDAAAQMAGKQASEVVGRDDSFIFRDEELAKLQEADRWVFEHQQSIEVDDVISQPGGSVRMLHTIKSPMYDDDGVLSGLFGIGRDVTERVLMEQALVEAKDKAGEGNRLKTAFLQNISHEIRTPLNAIIGFSDLLAESPDISDKYRKYAQVISQSSEQLLNIINHIIKISALETGQEKIMEYDLDLYEMMDHLYDQFKLEAAGRGLALELDMNRTDRHFMVYLDGLKLFQIMQNLLDNALKYTEKGKVRFGFTLKDGKLVFSVEDTGLGIPEEMQKHIFERFVRVESDETIKIRGSGLGLSISMGYAELMGGTIEVASTLKKGSLFHVILPYRKANPVLAHLHSTENTGQVLKDFIQNSDE